jgi:hypothetical protein
MGTEDMAPGDEFPTHKHLEQDELVYIERGTVHVRLGEQERDLHAGGTVFIPASTWVDIKNAGAETVSVVFVFSEPGFENYMRCDSVLPNEKVTPLSLEGQKECSHQGHGINTSRSFPQNASVGSSSILDGDRQLHFSLARLNRSTFRDLGGNSQV